jgi:predicted phage gp36 major capsid-like protein
MSAVICGETTEPQMSLRSSQRQRRDAGDFRRGYLIVDRQGVRVLRDPYSAKPYVLFYTTKRVGGGVQDFDAIKLLKFAVS